MTSEDRFLDDFAAMKQVVQRRYRRVLEDGGPFPDLIVIDGGKGQLAAAYEALESLGLANLVAVGLAKKEELIFTRDHVEPDRPGGRRSGAAPAAADPRRGAPVRHHLPPRVAREARRCAPSSTPCPASARGAAGCCCRSFGSLAGVRRASREDLESVVGAKVADAVLRHFGSLRGGTAGCSRARSRRTLMCLVQR